jgi:hypothetical protein
MQETIERLEAAYSTLMDGTRTELIVNDMLDQSP